MAIRSILVPVRGDGLGTGLLDHALAIAKARNAHLDVVHCRARPEDMLPFGVFLPSNMRDQIKSAAGNMADTEEAKLRPLFDAYAREHNLKIVESPPWPDDALSISWCERTGKQANIIALLGRLSDLIVVPKPNRETNVGFNTLESALFSAGKPVLMCPEGSPKQLGEHLAIAWNGSTEAARLVASGLALLSLAKKVTILAVGAEMPKDVGPDALSNHLKSHGIDSEIVVREESRIAQTLLSECSERGVDTLMMGAYGQSRRLELIMGGVTQHIVEHADLPVLMGH